MAARRKSALGSTVDVELAKLKRSAPRVIQRQAEKMARARRMPFHECLINTGWQEKLFATLLVSRRRPDGGYAAATFVVDLGCLGVRVAGSMHQLSAGEYRDLKQRTQREAGGFEAITPERAARVIEQGLRYSVELGFSPVLEYFAAIQILHGVSSSGDDVFVPLGYDSKPFYVENPLDDTETILTHLRTRFGEDGFTHVAPDP